MIFNSTNNGNLIRFEKEHGSVTVVVRNIISPVIINMHF